EAILAERRAQPGHQSLERVRRARRHLLAPQHVHEPITRNHLVGMYHQHCEQTALLGASEANMLAVAHDLQRAQHPQRRRRPVVHRPSNPPNIRPPRDHAATTPRDLSLTLWSTQTFS